ncbi:MAG: PLP-dependent aminotransferase family protein [Pseudomonadota bacterium]
MDTISISSPDLAELPKYKAVAEALRGQINGGALAVGAKLPPVRDLAWDLKITPGTVARAYTLLTDEGLLEAVVGRGTFVADQNAAAQADQNWARQVQPQQNDGSYILFSPRLPDMGQVGLIREHLRRATEVETNALLNYPRREDFEPARKALLNWLDPMQVGPVHHEDIVWSHGGQNGINMVMQCVLRGSRPVILVEETSYAGFRRAAELLRAEVVGVPMDEHGLRPDALRDAIRQHDAQLLCTSLEVHNPTGITTPLERRHALASVIRETGIDVLEDDCYRLGTATGPGYRALLPDQGWYVSSFSKTMTPALRIGYAIAPKARNLDLRRVGNYGFFSLARPMAEAMQGLLEDPRTRSVTDAVREELGRYVKRAINHLGRFNVVWHADVPFLWLTLPPGWRAPAFLRAAEAEGVMIRAADEFAMRDTAAPQAVRIAVNAQMPIEQFDEAMAILRRLLDNPTDQITV